MEKKTLGIILIILLILFCACPGLCIASVGIFTTYVGNMADLGIEGFEATGNTDLFGAGGIITGIVLFVIAVVGIFFAARMMKQANEDKIEEIPPAI